MPHVQTWTFPSSCWSFGYSLFERNVEWKLQRSIKNTRYDEPFSIESLKESASKVWIEVYFAVWRDWDNFNMVIDQKRYVNVFSLPFLWNKNDFTTIHTYNLQNSKCSFYFRIASYEKCCICRDYLGTDRQTHRHTRKLL